MAVFPERMKPLDPNNPEESLKIIEDYLRYMTERLEFTHSNDNKFIAENDVSASGVVKSLLEFADRLGQLERIVELLQEQLSS